MTGLADYAGFAGRIRAEGLVSDPWCDGHPRFGMRPFYLAPAEHERLAVAAEHMTAAHDELARLVMADEQLLETYFHLGEVGRSVWDCSAPQWHGVARADLFLTKDGIACCELNSDTPSGHAEAVTLSRLFADAPGADPNADLEARFCGLIGFSGKRLGKALSDLVVGIVYPTEFTEDLGLVLLYERWLSARGAKVVLGSPFNLRPAPGGKVALLGTPCDVFFRHYKTDWWVEREPVWLGDEPFPDAQPLSGPLALLLEAEARGSIVVQNPFGAIIPQNKRGLAVMWEERSRFSPRARSAIEAFLPPSFRLETLDALTLRANREAWVLKSDYGCEGEETVVGKETAPEIWEQSLVEAVPGRWIAQRYFESRRDAEGNACNLGVYVIGGAACGVYGRVSKGPTDGRALSVAVRIGKEPS